MSKTLPRTLSIIKPDAVAAKKIGAINKMIEDSGFTIIATKKIMLNSHQASNFYIVHKSRPFFKELVDFMVSGSIVVQVLEKENAVIDYRQLMGSTDPALADDGTIRKYHGSSIEKNAVHGSDSAKNAKIEIAFFFSDLELLALN